MWDFKHTWTSQTMFMGVHPWSTLIFMGSHYWMPLTDICAIKQLCLACISGLVLEMVWDCSTHLHQAGHMNNVGLTESPECWVPSVTCESGLSELSYPQEYSCRRAENLLNIALHHSVWRFSQNVKIDELQPVKISNNGNNPIVSWLYRQTHQGNKYRIYTICWYGRGITGDYR